jgi:hypothetical protein
MAKETGSPLVGTARALLAEAEAVVGPPQAGGEPGQPSVPHQSPATGVLDLYERLSERLDAVDSEKISSLLTSIDQQVADLKRLSADMERVVRVKRNLADS